MRLLVASTSKLAIPSIRVLQHRGFDIIGVLTKSDKPTGRGQVAKPQPIAVDLAGLLPIYKVSDHRELESALRELKPDLVIAIAFGMLVRVDSLRIPKYGWINLHFSLLPKYRGAAPVQRAILSGDELSGLTVFQLDEGMDTGPIYVTQSVSIARKDAGTVLNEMSELGGSLLSEAIEKISKGLPPTPQSGDTSLAKKISSEEARILFARDAQFIERQIRAFSPKPGAWCTFRGSRVKIFSSQVDEDFSAQLGEVIGISPLKVSTAKGSLVIGALQESGKRLMQSDEWARGSRVTVGEKFE